jgi:hypothetical protein
MRYSWQNQGTDDVMANYRKPTEKETEKLNKSRQKMIEGIEGEKDIFSKMMPTMAKAARDDIRAAKAMRESVPASAREGEAYQDAGYKKGGKVKKFAEGGYTDLEKFGLDAGLGRAGLRQTSKTPEERALGIGLKEGSPDYKKAVETLAKQKKSPSLPSETITQQSENPVTRKFKDMAKSVMSRMPSAMAAKKGAEMSKKYPRESEGESAFEEEMGMKKGGKVSSASKRADGCAIRGKTRA